MYEYMNILYMYMMTVLVATSDAVSNTDGKNIISSAFLHLKHIKVWHPFNF